MPKSLLLQYLDHDQVLSATDLQYIQVLNKAASFFVHYLFGIVSNRQC